jgi:hypothetical protein
MTYNETFEKYPYNEQQYGSKQKYYTFVGTIVGNDNTETVGRFYRRYAEKINYETIKVKRSETLNAKGEIISEKYAFVKEDEIQDKTDYEAKRLTTNPYGGQWVKYEKKKLDYFDIKDAIIKELENYIPEYPTIKREKTKENHLLVVDPADIHIGKLARSYETGEEYNSEIAIKRVLSGINGLLNKSIGFNIDKVLLIIGNDILHTDTPKRTTTSGTPQDTDGMWYDNFLTAKSLYVKVIEQLMQVADLTVHYNPSNHDYTSGFYLADCLATWFRTSKNITFNTSISHRKYLKYHSNLIGTTHGDGAKDSDLPLLMAQESKDWTDCKHRYIYTHHIHHKKSKDYGSVCVESLRSPSGTDSWHHRNGYQHAPKAVEAFIHDKNDGQIARINHVF